MHARGKFCIAVASLLMAVPVSAESFIDKYLVDPEDGQLDVSRYLSEVPLGFLPVPALITDPAVGTGFGLGAVFFHESDEQKKIRLETLRNTHSAILPTNISFLGLAATVNGTKAAAVGHLGFWKQDQVRYKGFLLYPDANLDFYSLGELELPNDRGVELSLTGPVVVQELKMRVAPKSNFFWGARQVYRQVDLSLTNASGFAPFNSPQLNQRLETILGTTADIATSGLGFLVEYDSRDNPFNPEKGYLLSTRYQWFDESIGSDVEYQDHNLTTLGYWELSQQFLLGLRFQYDSVEARDGELLPPYVLPFVDLRGIPKVRYQGRRVAVVEAELDWRLTPRWKVSLFSGSGHTADHFNELDSGDASSTVGTGFRYLIARRYGFSMGLDVARGPEETAFYIQAGSTW